jgi:hypothetical protein
VLYSVVGAPLFLYLVLAVADRQLLRSRGFERTAPVALALVHERDLPSGSCHPGSGLLA